MSEVLRKREIVLTISAIVALIVLLDFFTTIPVPGSTVIEWAVVLAAFAMGLGVVSVFRLHVQRILKRTPGQWVFSIWLLFVLTITCLLGLGGYVMQGDPSQNMAYKWIMDYVYSPLTITQYGITGFFILSASYRTLRARSGEAWILLICALLTATMNMTIMEPTKIPLIGRWIYLVPAVGSWRGVWIAMAIGVAAISFRVLLGKEKGYLAE